MIEPFGTELGRYDQELAVVARLNVAERRGVWNDHSVRPASARAGHVPDVDRIALSRTRVPQVVV